MAKLVLNDIVSLANTNTAKAALNSNFTAIEEAIENTLSRDGALPNQMEADIDLNDNDLLNVKSIDAAEYLINGVPLQQSVTFGSTVVDIRSGTGVLTSFPLSQHPGALANLDVSIDGVTQRNGLDFNFTGTTIEFAAPPPAGTDNILIRYDVALLNTDFILRADLASPTTGKGSELVTYKSDAANTIAQTVKDRLDLVVSVREFDAVGDGVNDDGPAFNNAIAHVLSLPTGARLYIPTGTYKILTQVVIPSSFGKGKLIYGDGDSSVIEVSDVSGGAAAFHVGQALAMGNVNVSLERLKFVGDGVVGKALQLQNANVCKIDHCTFMDMETAVSMQDSFAVQFRNCFWRLVTNYGVVTSTPAHHTTFNDCLFHDCGTGVAFGTCIQFGGPSDNIVIRDSDFEGNRRVLIMDGGSSVLLDGNYIENSLTTILDVSGATKISGLSVRNNWLSNNNPWQINMVDGGELVFNKINVQNISFNTATVTNFDVGNNIIVASTVAPAPFTAVTVFLNGYSGSNVGYKRHNDGTVELAGTLILGTNNTAGFQLPVGYRPLQTVRAAAYSATMTAGTVLVDAGNGNVVPNTAGADVSLNGLRFAVS